VRPSGASWSACGRPGLIQRKRAAGKARMATTERMMAVAMLMPAVLPGRRLTPLPVRSSCAVVEQQERAMDDAKAQKLLEIATTAAQLSSATALCLHRRGALHPKESEHLALLAHHLGELFQDAGHDDMASDFGAHAALLRKPPGAAGG
jgi:hypothetical protein